MPEFKHLGKQGFPHADGVNVYKFDNQFDYKRYDYDQMKITVCSVPWDLGEAHIGNRSIDGIGNVVYFGSKDKRDAWFAAIPDSECFRFETKYKELHRDNKITVPIPFDVAACYNYVFVEYSLFANDDSPIEYESDSGVRKWCYFIRNVRFVAPNTSMLEIMDDTWQTFIYDMDVTGMILERGHAPMFASDVDNYLANPLDNSKYLLAEDVNFGELQKVAHTKAVSLNTDNMYACIVTSGYVTEDWGTKDGDTWHTPAPAHATIGGVPNFYVMALPAASLNTLLAAAKVDIPQWFQTVQAVFFIEGAYLNLGDSFTFCRVTCNLVTGGATQQKDVLTLTKAQFGYPDRYANIAKLYTFPYAALEITDEKGNSSLIHIEETTGAIGATVASNVVFPYMNLQAVLTGIGTAHSITVSFANVSAKSFPFSGRWYEHLMSWDIPSFAVLLQASTHYDYATHFDRMQMENDRQASKTIGTRDATNAKTNGDSSASTTQANANASATTAQTNANASAATAQTNTNASATTASANAQNIANASYTAATVNNDAAKSATDTQADASKVIADNNAQNMLDNAAAQVTCNSTLTTKANQESTSDANLANSLQQALQAWDAGYSRDTVNADTKAAWYDAGVSSASGIIGSAASGGVSGAVLGPTGAALGAIGGLVSGVFGAATTAATTAITTNLESSKTEAAISNSQSKVTATTANNTQRTNTANNCRTGQRDATNALTNTSANNTASTMKENGTTSRNAAKTAATTIQAAANRAAATTRDAAIAAAQATEKTTKANSGRTYDTTIAMAKCTYDTTIANSGRTYTTQTTINKNDYDTAIADTTDVFDNAGKRIENLVKQAALDAPLVYGRIDNGATSTTKPQAIFANVVTESNHAIAGAGDEFLRYGYYLNQYWVFDGNWCVGKHFTYWKLKDYWVDNNSFQDQYQDAIRFFLMGGVTVWSRPEDIGKVSIYDNQG